MLKITIETDSGTSVIDFSAEEQRAFEYVANGTREWIDNAIRNRVRKAVNQVVTENSDKQPGKIGDAEKLQIVKDADIKSARERNDEFEAVLID